MIVTIRLDGGDVVAATPCGSYVTTSVECPSGGHYLDAYAPQSTRGHDTIEGDAVCMACGAHVGRLVVKASTIFGLEEDAAVGLRARVYR